MSYRPHAACTDRKTRLDIVMRVGAETRRQMQQTTEKTEHVELGADRWLYGANSQTALPPPALQEAQRHTHITNQQRLEGIPADENRWIDPLQFLRKWLWTMATKVDTRGLARLLAGISSAYASTLFYHECDNGQRSTFSDASTLCVCLFTFV